MNARGGRCEEVKKALLRSQQFVFRSEGVFDFAPQAT